MAEIDGGERTQTEPLPLALSEAPSRAVLPQGQMPPVFLHASFRSAGTWLWEKLRSAPTTFAYYEIFHETLSSLTMAEARGVNFTTWPSRHPATPPYFLEFLPLLQPGGGALGYDPAMAFARFIPQGGPDGELATEDQAFVSRLIDLARQNGRIPVLACPRSFGRTAALRRAFGGRTILLHRNLFHQWASYCSLADMGNDYFLQTIRMTIEASAHDPFLNAVATWFDLGNSSSPHENLFAAFVLLHLYLQGAAFDAADLVVDVTEIATSMPARRYVEREMSEMVRHPIDLSDVRHVFEPVDMKFAWSKQIRDTIEQFAKLIPARSAQSILFVEKTKDRALEEWEKFDFFSRGARTVLTGQIHDLEARLTEQAAVTGALRAETERLGAALSEASRMRDGVVAETEALAGFLAASRADVIDRDARIAELSAERDAAVAEAASVAQRRDDLECKIAEAKAGGESLAHRLLGLLARRR